MSDLGGGIDELKRDFFQSVALGLGKEGLTESDQSLPGSADTTLDHEPVLVDLTVVREATHRGDGLLGQVLGSGSVELLFLLSDA